MQIKDRNLKLSTVPYVIAEIGCNHNGDIDLCKKMIIKASECGCDAVKMQKRFNDKLFMKSVLNSPYQSEYAKESGTYGEHRQYLDRFGKKEFKEFKDLADMLGLDFIVTAFDFDSVDFLEDIEVEIYKIASCDAKNLPLIEKVANLNKPMIISTGGSDLSDVEKIYHRMLFINRNFAFLHCVSTYPNKDQELNLDAILVLRDKFKGTTIGWSSHHPGIMCNFLAAILGAKIIEVHFTFNRAWAAEGLGGDHAFSLEPQALRTLCYDLKRIEVMKGKLEKKASEAEKKGFVRKFGKAWHPIKPIEAGEMLTSSNVALKAPAEGLSPFENPLGRIAILPLSTSDTLTWEKVE